MSNPFTLTFQLKQHTPIIHFQHDQVGATLRASELKPKLDRFILIKLGNGNYNDGISIARKHNWLIGTNEKAALNFKFRVNVDAAKVENASIDRSVSSFFGNMGGTKEKHFSFINGNIECLIFSLQTDLLKDIKQYISDFFSLHNVGTRQSKGFGSFTVTELNQEIMRFPENTFKYSFKLTSGEIGWAAQSRDILNKIDWFYRCLRSGINLKDKNSNTILYFKSCLFMYLNNQDPKIQWDKKTIKAHLFNKRDYNNIEYMQSQNNRHGNPDILNDPELQNNELELKDYRDLFGLSSNESWFYYGKDSISKNQVQFINNVWKPIENALASIQRYKSPILFKPTYEDKGVWKIYFDVFLSDVEKDYYGTKMSITSKSNNPRLILPIAGNFNFHDYFTYTFQNIDPGKHAKFYMNKQANDVVESLTDIFSQLKTQVQNGQ